MQILGGHMNANAMKALGFATAALVAALPAWPQATQTKERIEVNGSNIKRVEGETALPVTVISRQEIEKSGATNPIELLNLISANNSLGNVTLTSVIGAATNSAQTASLRGLQGGHTLVLINGKRVNNFAGETQGVSGVNLAVIPFSAIERIEILKDGASAVYGRVSAGGIGMPFNRYPDCGAPWNVAPPAHLVPFLGANCYFDPARMPGVNTIGDDRNLNAFLQGKLQLGADWQAYAHGLYS